MSRDIREKLIDFNTVEGTSFSLKVQGKKIVSTNGCFDILHLGHVRYLNEARRLGDVLWVGVNSDQSVKKLKGPDRPIQSEQARAEILAALECVDYVTIFHEGTPEEFLKRLKPNTHVKGGDYSGVEIPEKKVVESLGGTVKFLKFTEGHSTSKILESLTHK